MKKLYQGLYKVAAGRSLRDTGPFSSKFITVLFLILLNNI